MSEPYRQYRVAEFSFQAAEDHAGNASAVRFDVLFTGPEGTQYNVPGFWDGGKTWRARLNPLEAGAWAYATSAPGDAGLNGQTGTFDVLPAAGDNPLHRHGGILRVSEDGHHLTHTDGTPFFWLGDTWWFCPSTLVPYGGSSNPEIKSAFQFLINRRAEQGFSVVHMAFLNSGEMLNQDADPAYSRQMDYYMAYANEAGIVPVVAIAFHSMMDTRTLDEWQERWRFVIARLSAYHVTWLITGEYNADNGPLAERIPKVEALGQFIKDTDPYHRAMTVHPWWYAVEVPYAWDWAWNDFVMIQGGHGSPPPTQIYLDQYTAARGKPVLEGECRYERIRGHTDADVRHVAWRAVQSGSFGYTYGAHGLWYPTQSADDDMFWQDWGVSPPWWEAAMYPGGDQMSHLRRVHEQLEWWLVAPRPGSASSPDVLVKSDGAAYLVYFTRGLDPSEAFLLTTDDEGCRYRAQWCNPRSGAYAALADPLVSHDGQLPLPARENSEDWVLLLRNLDEPVLVPDVLGMPREEAETIVRARGLAVVTEGYADPSGYVCGQEPAPGVSVQPESTVTICIVEDEAMARRYLALDVNHDGYIDAVDVQLIINAALGLSPSDLDVNQDDMANAVDIQLVINGALGIV